jgi:GntR family transcriptional regulator, galactonate operon transcriptional repressor
MISLHPVALLGGAGRKHNLHSHVVQSLGSRIVRGDTKAGDPFPSEAELGREFGASRSVIREAVKSLAARGLLESRTRTGIRVMPPMHWNLLDIDVLAWRYEAMPRAQFFQELFEIRGMIEPQAAALAAERSSPAEVAGIAAAYAAMERSDPSTNAAIEADLQFHRGILAASHNDLLLQMGNLIGVGLLVSYRISTDSYRVFLASHKAVLTAIEKRRPAAAQKAMQELLGGTKQYLETQLIGPGKKNRRRRATTGTASA